jgi:hypothetical protein
VQGQHKYLHVMAPNLQGCKAPPHLIAVREETREKMMFSLSVDTAHLSSFFSP